LSIFVVLLSLSLSFSSTPSQLYLRLYYIYTTNPFCHKRSLLVKTFHYPFSFSLQLIFFPGPHKEASPVLYSHFPKLYLLKVSPTKLNPTKLRDLKMTKIGGILVCLVIVGLDVAAAILGIQAEVAQNQVK